MRQLQIREHGYIYRWEGTISPTAHSEQRTWLEAPLYDRIKRQEDRHTARGRKPVFTWYDSYSQAGQWVGVIEVPGLQLEILPKVDTASTGEEAVHEVRGNLLYLLSMAGKVPIRPRDVARLASRQATLSEALIELFAERLRKELLKGPERKYQSQEENLQAFKGRLLIPPHLRQNLLHQERFFCRYDEFLSDTPMNRAFKATCRVLLETPHSLRLQDSLRHCLLLLEDVRDVPVNEPLLSQVPIDRQNERFRTLLQFSRMILSGRSPMPRAGQEESFSLLFDMNEIFEQFIASFLEAEVMPALPGYQLHAQARKDSRPLFHRDGESYLALKPDLLIVHPDGRQRCVIDTKWKRLERTSRGRVEDAGNDDLYQLFAYTHRYDCQVSMLLYPRMPGLESRDYDVLDGEGRRSGKTIGMRFVNLNRTLYDERERVALADELRELVRGGFRETNLAPG